MTETRRSVGRITFVGGGPGDPGLLSRRALAAIAAADQIVHDRWIPEPLLAAVRTDAGPDVEVTAAEGGPGELAKGLVAAAREGRNAVYLVAGDPFARASIVKEMHEVAEAEVRFEVVPGVDLAAGVAAYAGVPMTGSRTTSDLEDVAATDFALLAQAVARGSVALALDAGDLAALRDGLLAAGVAGETPVTITGDGSGETQYTTTSTVENFVAAALGFAGRVVVAIGAGVAQRDQLSWWESRPLYGWKVLVPRTKEQAGVMSARLREYGAIPTEVPTIAVEPPRTPAQMERAVKGLVDGRYAWIIFTSANAVKAVWEKFTEHGLDARHFGGVKIACIGPATADAVRAFGIRPELMPAEVHTTEGLLEEFPPYDDLLDPVGRVLMPRADIATEILAAGLVDKGWEVDDVTAYRTVRASPPPAEIRDAIKSGGFDAVLFTSSSTVRNLVGIAGKPHARTVVAAIGPKTAETVTDYGLRVDVRPEKATVADQVEALAEYAVELREKLATMPTKQRRGAKVQGPTALRFR